MTKFTPVTSTEDWRQRSYRSPPPNIVDKGHISHHNRRLVTKVTSVTSTEDWWQSSYLSRRYCQGTIKIDMCVKNFPFPRDQLKTIYKINFHEIVDLPGNYVTLQFFTSLIRIIQFLFYIFWTGHLMNYFKLVTRHADYAPGCQYALIHKHSKSSSWHCEKPKVKKMGKN